MHKIFIIHIMKDGVRVRVDFLVNKSIGAHNIMYIHFSKPVVLFYYKFNGIHTGEN